jgi:hypothetical protein
MPGLTGRMDPVPDHGEESYQGSGRLAGKKALITGGDSGIGRAVAIAYAREGADVAISYLPEEQEDAAPRRNSAGSISWSTMPRTRTLSRGSRRSATRSGRRPSRSTFTPCST